MYRCTGSESDLSECDCMTGSTAEDCGHRGDVGVECYVPQQCSNVTRNVNVYLYSTKSLGKKFLHIRKIESNNVDSLMKGYLKLICFMSLMHFRGLRPYVKMCTL